MVGGPAGINQRISGTIRITDNAGMSRAVHTSPNGSFAVRLRPGVYRITGRSPKWNAGERDCTVTSVRVREDRTSHRNVLCEVF
jgi:hypothetical protein